MFLSLGKVFTLHKAEINRNAGNQHQRNAADNITVALRCGHRDKVIDNDTCRHQDNLSHAGEEAVLTHKAHYHAISQKGYRKGNERHKYQKRKKLKIHLKKHLP